MNGIIKQSIKTSFTTVFSHLQAQYEQFKALVQSVRMLPFGTHLINEAQYLHIAGT